MTATLARRTVILIVALVAVSGVALAFAIQYVRREPPADTSAVAFAPAISKPASGAREQGPAPLVTAKTEANAIVDALAGSAPPPENSDGVPTFDVARIEPTGEAVIAGRAAPGATVELLRDGEVHDRAVADQSGQFVIVLAPASTGYLRPDAALEAAGRQAGHIQAECGGGARAESRATDRSWR